MKKSARFDLTTHPLVTKTPTFAQTTRRSGQSRPRPNPSKIEARLASSEEVASILASTMSEYRAYEAAQRPVFRSRPCIRPKMVHTKKYRSRYKTKNGLHIKYTSETPCLAVSKKAETKTMAGIEIGHNIRALHHKSK